MTLNSQFDRAKKYISESVMPLLGDESKSNAVQVTIQLMNYLKIPVTNSTIQTRVEEHAEFPSLICISDALNIWNVKNQALKVEKENLHKLPTPFIAHINKGIQMFQTITKVTESEIYYLTDLDMERRISRKDFTSIWTGVVLATQPAINYKEIDYEIKKSKERWEQFRKPFILISCLLIAIIFFSSGFLLYKTEFYSVAILFSIKLGGFVVTSMLLLYELNMTTSAIRKICTISRKFNCQAILESSAAKIFGKIGWSEIGFFYFAGGVIYLLVSLFSIQQAIEILRLINLLAIPYVFYSLLYQWRIAKIWCPLCLLVQGLLLSEFLTFFIGSIPISDFFHFNARLLIIMLVAYFLPILFWVFSKKYIVKAKDANTFKQEFFRLKHNKEIFDTILAQQKQIVLPSENIGIVIGSNDAEYKIIMVSNPSCIACQTAHNSIKGLLCDHKNLKVQILFTINDDVHSNRNHFIRYIMALYEFDPEKALFALDEWYNSRMKNQQEIERKFPLENDKYNAEKLLEMDKWCKDAKISATPTFFIHGHQLPTVYNISDLSYLIT